MGFKICLKQKGIKKLIWWSCNNNNNNNVRRKKEKRRKKIRGKMEMAILWKGGKVCGIGTKRGTNQ